MNMQSEHEPQQRQRQTEALFNAIPDGAILVDDSGLILRTNEAVERMLGWKSEELIGRTVETLIPERFRNGRTRLRFQYAAAPQTLRMASFQIMALHRGGNEVPVVIMLGPLRGAGGSRFLVSIRDMIEYRRSQQGLAYLSSVVKSADDSIMGTDLEGVVVSWNHGGEKLFGYTEEEALGKHLIFLSPQDRRSECFDNLRRIGQREYLPRYESRRVRKDGSEFDVSVIVSPITDSQGNLLGMSSICRDITERKRAEGVLQVAKQTADMASRAKSEFLTNMSHELRTPLNGVIGLTNAVLDSELTEEQREHLTLVKDSANSLLTILTDILDMARIQSGKYVLQPKEFLLRDLMDRTMREFEAAAHDKNLQFTWHIQPDVPPVFLGDSSCLRQILSNVVQNAIKFTAAGEVAVTVEVPSQDPGMLSFTVRDTGIGVPVEQQRIIFEPFSQVDNSLRRKFGGTGLGLAICGQLIDIMGGRIWVDSDGHTGSTFRFRARLEPVHADSEKTATEPGVQPTPSERRREIRRAADGSALMRILRPFSLLPLEVQLLNLSKGGLKVRTSQSLDFGALVQINRTNTVTIAEVRYCIPDGNQFHVGLKIISDIHD